MLTYFEVKSATKELSAKGQLTARTRVRPGRYDVLVGEKRFQALLVSELHINSSVPQRGLTIECGLDAFALDRDIRKGLESPPSSMVLKPIAKLEPSDERISEQFELVIKTLYVYVTLGGCLLERSPDRSDGGLFWVLGRKAGCQELGLAYPNNAICSLLVPEAYQQLKQQVASGNAIDFPITIAGEAGHLRKQGEQLEMTFLYTGEFVDSLPSNLKAGHRCLIPFGFEETGANQPLASSVAANVDMKTVGY